MKLKQTLAKVHNDYARLFNVGEHADIIVNAMYFLISHIYPRLDFH